MHLHAGFTTQLWCFCLIRIITLSHSQTLLNRMLFFSFCLLLLLCVLDLMFISLGFVLLQI